MGSDVINIGSKNAEPVIHAPPVQIPLIKLTLVLDPATGRMDIHGPVHNKQLCAQMLFDAGKTIMDMRISELTKPAGNA